MSTTVTTDHSVLKGWPKDKDKAYTSVAIAEALGLTVFQVTARLKGMEGRGFLTRDEKGHWLVTDAGLAERDNPSPSIDGRARAMRATDRAGGYSGPPKDDHVPRIKLTNFDWAPSDENFKRAQQQLPIIQAKLADYLKDKMTYKREIMALSVERDHCKKVIEAKKGRAKWTSRTEHTPQGAQTIYIAPDMREYVFANAWEVADLLIESATRGLSPARLRLYSTSAIARSIKKARKEEQNAQDRETAKTQEARNERILADESTLRSGVRAPKLHQGGDKARNKAPGRKKAHGRAPARRKSGRTARAGGK